MRIATVDLISNTCFPVRAADELGLFKAEGLDVSTIPPTCAISHLPHWRRPTPIWNVTLRPSRLPCGPSSRHRMNAFAQTIGYDSVYLAGKPNSECRTVGPVNHDEALRIGNGASMIGGSSSRTVELVQKARMCGAFACGLLCAS